MSQSPLTESEVKQMVDEWYLKLDIHAPAEEFLPLLAEEGLEMRFPEGTLHGYEEFKKWYETTIITRYFDEIHTMKELNIAMSEDGADVRLVVDWQTRRWKPPAPKSEWLGFDCYQTLVVKRSDRTGKPVILTYVVDELDPMEGSAPL